MKYLIAKFVFFIKVNKLIELCNYILYKSNLIRYERASGCTINFVPQGQGGVVISGDLSEFFIPQTSHLKSGTFIECSGGVQIGEYFHPGRGLTIFSTNHNYESENYIPYDKVSISKRVLIGDFVWVGANVTIVPGVAIGEGAVVGAGSVVSRDVPAGAVVAGNPAKIIKYRDSKNFKELKARGRFF